jgi:DNA/RNA-binding domain of Phe-tRNA-synthetase-like protein
VAGQTTSRCWNWRQCVRARTTPSAASAVFILDGLSEPGGDAPAAAGEDLAGLPAALHRGARLSSRRPGAGR